MGNFLTINEAAKATGHPPYRIRQWILTRQIRFNKAGNRYIINLEWLYEDLKRMAEENIAAPEERAEQYGRIRRVSI